MMSDSEEIERYMRKHNHKTVGEFLEGYLDEFEDELIATHAIFETEPLIFFQR